MSEPKYLSVKPSECLPQIYILRRALLDTLKPEYTAAAGAWLLE